MGLVELSVSVVMRVLTLFLPSGDAIPALAFLHIDQYGDATTLNVSWIAPKNVSVTVRHYSTHKAFKHFSSSSLLAGHDVRSGFCICNDSGLFTGKLYL